MRKLLISIGVVIASLGTFPILMMHLTNPNEYIPNIIYALNTPIETKDRLNKFISNHLFEIVLFFQITLYTASALLIIYHKKIAQLFRATWYSILLKIRFFKRLSKQEKLLLWLIIASSLSYNIYNVVTRPISYDEAWTFLNFTRRGIITSISYYPAPNNHILHSVLTNFTNLLPFETTVNLRLPNLITSFFTSILFFYTFSKIISKQAALIILPLFCMSFPFVYYSYLSRGYMLVLFAFIICFYSTTSLTKSKINQKDTFKYYLYLSVGAIIGIYSIPSYAYAYLTCLSFILIHLLVKRKHTLLLPLIISFLITSITVTFLYLPIFVGSGLQALVANRFVKPISRFEVLDNLALHFNDTSIFLSGFQLIFTLGIITLILLLLLLNRKNHNSIFSIYCFSIAPLMIIAHGVIPFPRTWIYLIVPLIALIGLAIKTITCNKSIVNAKNSILITALTTLTMLLSNRKINSNEISSYQYKDVSKYLVKNNAKNIYTNHPFIATNLIYLFEINKTDIDVKYALKANSLDTEKIKIIRSCCEFLITQDRIDKQLGFDLVKDWGDNIYLSKVNNNR